MLYVNFKKNETTFELLVRPLGVDGHPEKTPERVAFFETASIFSEGTIASFSGSSRYFSQKPEKLVEMAKNIISNELGNNESLFFPSSASDSDCDQMINLVAIARQMLAYPEKIECRIGE